MHMKEELEKGIANAEELFNKLKQQGAVHEARIAEHQNALQSIREEMVRLQGERRALERLISKETVPCNTPSNQETDFPK